MTMLKHRHMLRKTKVSEQQGYRGEIKSWSNDELSFSPMMLLSKGNKSNDHSTIEVIVSKAIQM